MKKTLLIIAMATLTACAAKDEQPKHPVVGMANPASVYCEKLGGKLEIVNENDGQVSYCKLPNGEIVEEWALFRRDHRVG